MHMGYRVSIEINLVYKKGRQVIVIGYKLQILSCRSKDDAVPSR